MLQASLFDDEQVVHLHSGWTELTPTNGPKVTERVFKCGERGPKQGEYAMMRTDGIYYRNPDDGVQGTVYATDESMRRHAQRQLCPQCVAATQG